MPHPRFPFNRRISVTAFDGFEDVPLGDDDGCCGWRYTLRSFCDYLRTLPWHHVRNAYYAIRSVPSRFQEFIDDLSWSEMRETMAQWLQGILQWLQGILQWLQNILLFLRYMPQNVYQFFRSLSWEQFCDAVDEGCYRAREFLRYAPQHVQNVLRSLSWRCIRGNVIDWWWRRAGAEQY